MEAGDGSLPAAGGSAAGRLWCQEIRLQKHENVRAWKPNPLSPQRHRAAVWEPWAEDSVLVIAHVLVHPLLLLLFLHRAWERRLSPCRVLLLKEKKKRVWIRKLVYINSRLYLLRSCLMFPWQKVFCSHFLNPNLSGPIKPPLCGVIMTVQSILCSLTPLFARHFDLVA